MNQFKIYKTNIITITLIFTTFLITNSFSQNTGELDLSFGNGGKVLTSVSSIEDKAFSTAIQTDGKILVGGYSTSAITGNDFICIRYNTNGTIDNSFGNNGKVITDVQLGSNDAIKSIVLQTDSKILVEVIVMMEQIKMG